MWELSTPPLELVARSVLVYALFLVVLRISGKRELGQFTIFDLALVLLAANAMQPAITGPDASITGAVIIILTLFVLNGLVAFARQRSAIVRRLLEPTPTTIALNGKWIAAALAREGLDDDDVEAALREHGLASIAEVRHAVLERDGSISVVPREGSRLRISAHHRHYRKGGRQGP
ncbi:MAG TPA: YetF domain-containing protein [Candidatus Eisenbacteria bacterium]|nr:YetF domain-containing protein [Candidatus Eisenbacteria bacterium]